MRGMNSADIKRRNRGLVLKNIALGSATSRVAISKATGLTKMTVGNIVQELFEGGMIDESAPVRVDATGPNPQQLKISKTAKKIIGIYISRDELTVSIGDFSGNVFPLKTDALKKETLESLSKKLIASIKDAVKSQKGNIFAIGVAMIGPIDENGSIYGTHNFFGIKSFPVKSIIESNFDYPVIIYNDISASAVAEQLIGGGSYSDFIYIGIANGLGAGIIHNNSLMTSGDQYASEFGHTTIDYNGKVCPCGNIGCLELYVSENILCERLSAEVGKKIKVEDFETLADNQICDKIFTDVAEKLAIGMVNLSNLISPKAFILGYKAYYLPDKYIKMIEERINQLRFTKTAKLKVLKSPFKDKSAIFGSVCCVLKEVFDGDLLF